MKEYNTPIRALTATCECFPILDRRQNRTLTLTYVYNQYNVVNDS